MGAIFFPPMYTFPHPHYLPLGLGGCYFAGSVRFLLVRYSVIDLFSAKIKLGWRYMRVCDWGYRKVSFVHIKLVCSRSSNRGNGEKRKGGAGGENNIRHEIIRAAVKI